MTEDPETKEIAVDPLVARKRRYHHGDLGHALLAAVRTLIERDGPSGFSISEACRMAGVSTAAPYKHFKGKDDILRSLVMQGFEELGEAMTRARDADPGPAPRRIAAMGRAYVAFGLANPGLFRLVFGTKDRLKGAEDAELHACGHDCFSVLIEEVAGHLGPLAGPEAAKRLSVMLWTFVHGAASLAMEGDYEAAEVEVDLGDMIERATIGLLRGDV